MSVKEEWLSRKKPSKAKEAVRDMKKRLFLEAFVKTGQKKKACEAVGISGAQPRRWAQSDELFQQEYERAKFVAAEILEDEAHRRAVEGVDEPVWYKGEEVGSVKKYSDTLLIFLLKGLKPEVYRERYEVKNDTPQEVIHTHQLRDLSVEELKSLAQLSKKEKEKAGAQAEESGPVH